MENNIQPDNKNEKVYMAGEVGMLLENINDGIKIVAEGNQMLNEKIGGIERRLDLMDSRLNSIDAKLIVKADAEIVENTKSG